MDLKNLFKLEESIKKRMKYNNKGGKDGNVHFSDLIKLDKEIIRLIKITHNLK